MSHEAEQIERAALQALHDAADDEIRSALGIETHDIAGALVSIAAKLPASAIVINRTLGLGVDQPASDGDVQAIADAYAKAGVARYFVHWTEDAKPADFSSAFENHGLAPVRGWQKFERGRDLPPDVPTELEIREVGPEAGEEFARIVCSAFDLGDQAIPWVARLPGQPNMRTVMSYMDGEPAGTGAIFIKDGYAWTDWGATDPKFRRRGSQGALLRFRILLALAEGCTSIFTETGEAVPGDPQHSFTNICRMGFEPAYVVKNFAPPAPPSNE